MWTWVTFFALNGFVIAILIQTWLLKIGPPILSLMYAGVLVGGISGALSWRIFSRRDHKKKLAKKRKSK